MTVNPADLARFQSNITKFSSEMIPLEVDLFMRKVSLDILKGVVMKTPVDTGRMRGNWDVGVDAEPTGFDETKSDKQGDQTIQQNVSNLGTPGSLGKHGKTVFIVNNVPYAARIEDGHSKRKPDGVLGPTLREIL
tara:strand:- start:59 stop:463 length:405 start_codon:yes stop_codon:yes gene_type:complete